MMTDVLRGRPRRGLVPQYWDIACVCNECAVSIGGIRAVSRRHGEVFRIVYDIHFRCIVDVVCWLFKLRVVADEPPGHDAEHASGNVAAIFRSRSFCH